MVSLDTFKVCLMNHDRDYLDIVATSNENNGVRWVETLGTIRDPYIDYTPGVVAVTHNATFFGANF